MRVTKRVAARSVFDEHALDALAGNVRQLVLVDEGHLKPHLGTHVVLVPGSATKSQSSFPLVATTVSPLICIDTSRC